MSNISINPDAVEKGELVGLITVMIIFLAIGIYFASGKLTAVVAAAAVCIAVSLYATKRGIFVFSGFPSLPGNLPAAGL